MIARLLAAVETAVAQARDERLRTTLAVVGVALAVLATTLLSALGVGVVETGQRKFDAADRDLWVTGGPVSLAPGTVGGVENSIRDSHRVADRIRRHEDVATVGPLLFQTVYVSGNRTDYRTVAAIGVPSSAGLAVTEGEGFDGDPHYANGTYDGPMTHELLVDRRTAALFDVEVGETLNVGGTIAAAGDHRFVVTGISPTGRRFLGVPTVAMPMSELQELTGKTESDPATLVTVTTRDGADVSAVERDLQATFPAYDVRTNREQLRATAERQAVVLAGGASLIVLAVVAGLALTSNAVLSMVVQQRREYAALRALGVSTPTLTATVLAQTLFVGGLGAVLGVVLAVPATVVLNRAVAHVVGFEAVVRLSARVVAFGGAAALLVSVVVGLLAGLYISRQDPLVALRSSA